MLFDDEKINMSVIAKIQNEFKEERGKIYIYMKKEDILGIGGTKKTAVDVETMMTYRYEVCCCATSGTDKILHDGLFLFYLNFGILRTYNIIVLHIF